MPPGRGASEEVRELWRAEQVPSRDRLHADLVARGLRSKEDLERRKRRKEEADRKLKEERDHPKKSRIGKVLVWKNNVELMRKAGLMDDE